jgi:hypothetical protein
MSQSNADKTGIVILAVLLIVVVAVALCMGSVAGFLIYVERDTSHPLHGPIFHPGCYACDATGGTQGLGEGDEPGTTTTGGAIGGADDAP